jgi:hypothetical protein
MASGAAFGIAAQISLQRLGLDFDSIRSDVIAHRAATPHFALAWWAWWLLPLGAFFVGPLCIAATRAIVGGGQLIPGLRLFATAIAVLALAAAGQPRPSPLAGPVATNAAVSVLVVIGSTALALLGAHLLGGLSRDRTAAPWGARIGARLRHVQGSARCLAVPSLREGSANSGMPLLRKPRRHRLVHRSFSSARVALVTLLVVLVFAPVSVLAGSTVLLHLSSGHTVRAWSHRLIALTGAVGETRARVEALLPTEERGFTVAVATEPRATLDPVDLPTLRQLEISAAIGHGAVLSESDLTFTKGYPQRRAAQIAAGLIPPPATPQLTTTAVAVPRHDAVGLRFGQSARIPRSASGSRPRLPRAWTRLSTSLQVRSVNTQAR